MLYTFIIICTHTNMYMSWLTQRRKINLLLCCFFFWCCCRRRRRRRRNWHFVVHQTIIIITILHYNNVSQSIPYNEHTKHSCCIKGKGTFIFQLPTTCTYSWPSSTFSSSIILTSRVWLLLLMILIYIVIDHTDWTWTVEGGRHYNIIIGTIPAYLLGKII